MTRPGRILLVTGTDTDVGKTIATAALAAAFAATGLRVAVDKPAQTGVAPAEAGDSSVVERLAGVTAVSEGVRLLRPMAPRPAAALEGVTLPSLAQHADRIRALADTYDVVLVEGSGGVLVQLDDHGGTLADLADELSGVSAVVVCRSTLGTLNHTELTLEALDTRTVPVAGLIIGAWPADPDAIAETNRDHLRRLLVPFLGAIPAGAGAWEPTDFRAAARTWFARLP